ncbi:MAG TPA: hypothetical protein VMW49_02585, partial [Candidatus Dormibacteraeota bacterium]|nr:hypothetical protein [Candidatus Dormibacteraeota bacterium]
APRGWLVAGTRIAASGATTAMVWTSTDAHTWSASVLAGAGGQARAATNWGSRTVVVGSVGRGSAQRAAVWLSSAPGQPFVAVPSTAAFAAAGAGQAPGASSAAPAGAAMDHVAGGALGLLAAGTAGGVPALWYSTNGARWTRLGPAEKVVDSSPGARIDTLLVTNSGAYAGGSLRSGTHTDAAIWSSGDGLHWHLIRTGHHVFSGTGDHVVTSIEPFGTGLVAAGATREGSRWSPASWISPDGASWSKPSEAFPMAARPRPDAGGAKVTAMSAAPAGPAPASGPAVITLVAVGGSATAQRVWTSTDGLSWDEVPLPTGAADSAGWRATMVATDGPTTVVADGAPGQPHVLVDGPSGWQQPSADPAVFGAVRASAQVAALTPIASGLLLTADVTQPGQALGQGSTSVELLSSPDGANWAQLGGGPVLAGQTVTAVTSAPPGLVAVGGGTATTASLPAGNTSASVWTSPNGAAWSLASGGTEVFGGGAGPPAQALAVARFGLTTVAVGIGSAPASGAAPGTATTGGLAVAWTSTGGGSGPWRGPSALDPDPGLGPEKPTGACSGQSAVVAVGSGDPTGTGTEPLAWSSHDGTHWQPAAFLPTPVSGSLTGCFATANGFYAYGQTVSSSGAVMPAVWHSQDGSRWSLRGAGGLAAGPHPLSDMARDGRVWLAVGGSDDEATGTAPGAHLGLWRSANSGATWQRLSTSGAAWSSVETAALSRVAFVGTTAVVAGDVDGTLAVWTGLPRA